MNPTTNYKLKTDEQEFDLYFGNNTVNKFLELSDVDDVSKLQDVLAKSPFEILPKVFHSSALVGARKYGSKYDKDLEWWGFTIDEIDDKVIAEVWTKFQRSLMRLGEIMGGQAHQPKKASKGK